MTWTSLAWQAALIDRRIKKGRAAEAGPQSPRPRGREEGGAEFGRVISLETAAKVVTVDADAAILRLAHQSDLHPRWQRAAMPPLVGGPHAKAARGPFAEDLKGGRLSAELFEDGKCDHGSMIELKNLNVKDHASER
jgi:hypothetical protein